MTTYGNFYKYVSVVRGVITYVPVHVDKMMYKMYTVLCILNHIWQPDAELLEHVMKKMCLIDSTAWL